MKKFFLWLTKHKIIVLSFYIIIIILCAFFSTKVKVNSNLADYLPEDSDSTIALNEMEKEFTGDIPNAEMMVSDITMIDAAKLQDKIEAINGVKAVSGIKDANPLSVPYEFLGEESISSYYRDGHALYTLTLDKERKFDLLEELRNVTDKEVSLSGSFVTGKYSQKNSGPEIIKTVAIVIVFAIVLFMFTMDSWITPFILVETLICAVIINSGTNLIFGTISSVTNTAASVLQMGVSVDYFIFILHRYREYKSQGLESNEAMVSALTNSGSSVVSSSLTTVIGFAALTSMRYRIGMDMGIVLSKGVLISLICAFTLLPCLILSLEKMMNKTQYQQHYKRGINNNINNYNNNSYYSSNYYYNYNHKKNYISNSNNYNEERKKNNYYNNKINDGYNNEYNGYDDYNNHYDDYNGYNNQYEEYNEYDNGYNNNYIYPQNKKKKVYNRYNNINNNINNINNINLTNNFYDNNEETKIKTVNEIKQKKEVMKLKINLKEDKYIQLIIYKEDNIDEVVKEFCNLNNIDKELVNPLINKIKQSLKQIELITNNKIKLSRDSVLLLEKAKKRIQNK